MAVPTPSLIISDPPNQSGVLNTELCAEFNTSAYNFGSNLLASSEFEDGVGTGVSSEDGPTWTTDYTAAANILLAVDTWAFFDTNAGQVTAADVVAAGIDAIGDKSMAFNIGVSLVDSILEWPSVGMVNGERYVVALDIAAIDQVDSDPVLALYVDGDLVVSIPSPANDGAWHNVRAEFDWVGGTGNFVASLNGTNPGAGSVVAIDNIGLFLAEPIIPVDAGGYTITEVGRDETGIQYEICGTPHVVGVVAHVVSVTDDEDATASQSVNFTGVAATATCAAATDVEQTTATLNGTIGSIQAVGSVRFAIGTASGVYSAYIAASPYAAGAVTGSAVNLQPGTTYYYVVQVRDYWGNVVATSTGCSFATDAADAIPFVPCTDCDDPKVSLAPAQRVVVVADETSSVQYTEGAIDSTITGTAILWEDAADTLRAVSAAKPLPVSVITLPNVTIGSSIPSGTNNIGDVDILTMPDARDSWRVSTLNFTTADDSDNTFTVPAGTEYHILSVYVSLVTTATAGNRQMAVQALDSSDNILIGARARVTQAASLTRSYNFAPDLPNDGSFYDTDYLAVSLPSIFLAPGQKLRVFDKAAIDAAADDMVVRVQIMSRSVA